MTHRASATLASLRMRAELLARVREFFAARDVLEVETPALSCAGVSDLALESITARARSLGAGTLYLHTSPEYAMKRLLAAGSGDIYQICRVFRDDELGRWHQPEFTLLEWYRQGWDEQALMREVEELFTGLLGAFPNGIRAPVARVSYAQAFRDHLGVEPAAEAPTLAARLRAHAIDVPDGLVHGELLDLAFSTVVAPALERRALTFVFDFPASQAALARIKPQTPPVAARFEVFAAGIELANGFAELTDAAEQRERFVAELERRARSGRVQPPLDEAFLAALDTLPPCAGVAVGLDRVVALACGHDDVASAMTFVHPQPG
jgi:lysyl-tRNA synthetase class 2